MVQDAAADGEYTPGIRIRKCCCGHRLTRRYWRVLHRSRSPVLGGTTLTWGIYGAADPVSFDAREFAFLSRPGQIDIQTELFYDYRTNVTAYPTWQAWLRERQPRLLVLWGKYEQSFEISEPEAYRRDVPTADVHLLDGGHFVLDTAADDVAALVRGFLQGGDL
jgi:pimeloyl-ACP methyl ester carboxylesterase